MRKVLIYSLLLIGGMIASQFVPSSLRGGISLLTMFALSFIMIHVGYEFDIDKSQPRKYAKDYLIAASAATLPWLFCALYFVYALAPRELWSHADQWREAALQGLFASPTSAGVLFSMLAAAGLGASWVFAKARILAIFDDLNTILLLVPLQAFVIGLRWQLAVTVAVLVVLLIAAYRYLNRVPLPITWPWTLTYSAIIVAISDVVYAASKHIDPEFPLHLEVLLPAFALGCILKTPVGHDPHSDDSIEGTECGPELAQEQFVSMIVSACFMVLVGLSMPPLTGGPSGQAVLTFAGASAEAMAQKAHFPGWGMIAFHVLIVTILSNIGKMLPAFCYRAEASGKERLALAIGMFPRGEVGAGVLIIALGYGLGGPALTVAVLSLALNLLCTGVFIYFVKMLLQSPANGDLEIAIAKPASPQ